MPKEIYLLKVGMTMTEGVVDEWFIADGEPVEVGQPIYRLETEKVNMDVEAEYAGIVKHLEPAGKVLEPGDVIGWLYEAGEQVPDVLPQGQKKADLEPIEQVAEDTHESQGQSGQAAARQTSPESESKRVLAVVPAARRLARELNIDLETVTGTGPRGRITKQDVEAAASAQTSHATAATEKLSGIRKTIAERMFASLQNTAQLTMDMEVRMDAAMALRSELNELWLDEDVHLTYTDLILKALAIVLPQHERMNSLLIENEIHTHTSINLGVAVALPEGLIVPVIKDVQQKSMRQISLESGALATKAKQNTLSLDEVSDGTFTLTSLGMFGVDTFTPILNSPQTGILGAGRIYEGVQWTGLHPMKVHSMRLSLTWDHRVIDGAPAAQFLGDVKQALEQPLQLVTE